MSAAESVAAVERLASIREDLGAEDFAAYAFLALGVLAYQAPEVAAFILDRADKVTGRDPQTTRHAPDA